LKTNPLKPILIIDDEEETLKSFELLLLTIGFTNIQLCSDSRKALGILKEIDPSIILVDLVMPNLSGQELLAHIKRDFPEIPVIVATGVNDVETAVECMKLGAYDFLLKPVQKGVFQSAVNRAVEYSYLINEIDNLKTRILAPGIENPELFSSIITNNKSMLALFSYIEAVAPSPEAVLITGESGVGKELFARSLHSLSGRQGDFVAVNLAGLDDSFFTDTLFGHKKGSFTGAQTDRRGFVEKAAGGTLFLDEIGDLSLASQVKLLRLLQEKEFYPLGSDFPLKTDVRVVAATNKDLEELVDKEQFRRDLFYRLNTHSIHVPPLRDRIDDLPLLAAHFVEQAASAGNKEHMEFSPDIILELSMHSFPGNVRELRSILFDAVFQCASDHLLPGVIKACLDVKLDEKERDIGKRGGELSGASEIHFPSKLPTLKGSAELLINEALRRTGGNQSKAARLLGITHQALSKRLQGMRKSEG
jgi:DNA-binding NtrC family response regulator